MKRDLRLNLAVGMSGVALFVALGGDSLAARAVSKLKRGSVTSKAIKDRTIRTRDLSRGTVVALRGATGAAGPKGEPGVKGDTGAQGEPGPIGPTGPAGPVTAGADFSGTIGFSTGFVASGRCRDVEIAVEGAKQGQALQFTTRADLPDGIVVNPRRVSSDGTVVIGVCNFTATTMQAVEDLPVRILTFG